MKEPISRKKPSIILTPLLSHYLESQGRTALLPLSYRDLLSYHQSFPLLDAKRRDTLWETVIFPPSMQEEIERSLTMMYVILSAGGELSLVNHLYVDRVDFCTFGNTQPFRVRVVNRFNDNYDYFYVKRIDASRVVGLELEHILAPQHVNFITHADTLIEEHIIGIAGDSFIEERLFSGAVNRVRLAKEFIKFNERCFARLLGDMRSYNYVVNVIEDFDGQQYRIRPIDFDQQSYFGSIDVYLPQRFPENSRVVDFCRETMSPISIKQYQVEERTLLRRRMKSSSQKLCSLLQCIEHSSFAPAEYVQNLAKDLNLYHGTNAFSDCTTMGSLLRCNLQMILALQGEDPHFLNPCSQEKTSFSPQQQAFQISA